MNTFCTFYIVRHAESEANEKHIVAGHTDTSLSQTGLEQAKTRATDLKKISFAAAFSSDLVRAQKTAGIIAQEHDLAVTSLQVLRERNYGEFEGKNRETLSKTLANKLEQYEAMSYKERKNIKWIKGMEDDEEVVARFTTFLRETALAYPGKNVLVVSHGNIMRTFLVHLGFGTHQELSTGKLVNTGYYVLRSDGVDFEVVKTVGLNKS